MKSLDTEVWLKGFPIFTGSTVSFIFDVIFLPIALADSPSPFLLDSRFRCSSNCAKSCPYKWTWRLPKVRSFGHFPGSWCLLGDRVHGLKPGFKKCGHFFGSAQGVHTIVTTEDPQRHRAMRNAASPFFSAREMDHSFHIGRDNIQRAADSMAQKGQEGEPVDLHSYFQAIMVHLPLIYYSKL